MSVRSRKQSRRKRETVRRIPLHPELRAELNTRREDRARGQCVICEPDGSGPITPDRANRVFWQPIRGSPWCLDNGRGLFKVGFRTYRHSFASNMTAAGVDQWVLDEFMGHTTEARRKWYCHLFPANKRSAIESFSLGGRLTAEETVVLRGAPRVISFAVRPICRSVRSDQC